MRVEEAIGEYLTSLRVDRGLADNTLISYTRDLGKYAEYLAGRGVSELAEVDEEIAGGFADQLTGAASSRARTLTAVRSFHKFAATTRLSPTNPASALALPKQASRLPKAIPLAHITALIEAAGTAEPPLGLRDRALIELLYGTGGRISEIVGLDIDDIEFAERWIRLFGKGGKERLVPLGSYAHDAIDAYLVRARPALAAKGKGTPKLFLNTLGRPLSRQSAWAVVRAAAERAGLTGITPHTLRHSYATHLLEGGANIREVQELLGHASVTTTQIYTAVTISTLKETYATSHPRARYS
ncbi:MAG: site-specific tyrosine recombinase XerD [Flaviflexus sp.]|nr:site-specific tyrosine recombinase XerD [Flaviflexus sp.]